MLTGQTQKRFGKNEDPLEPKSIKDIKTMLDASGCGARIKNYKILSGIMFFEVENERDIERLGRKSYTQHYLVVGEDPNDKGHVAAIHLTDEAREVKTPHGSALTDTRGDISNVAWCSSFQFKRKILRNGKSSRSYSAIKSARRDYCEALLLEFDDLVPFKNQNWQAIQNVINRHQRLLYDEDDQPRPGAIGDESDDDDDQDDNHIPGPAPGNGADETYWRGEHNLLHRSDRDHLEYGDDYHDDDHGWTNVNDNVIDRDSDMEGDTIDTNQNHFDQYHSRSPSPPFIPHSRDSSPEVTDRTFHETTDDDDIDMDPYPAKNNSDLDDDLVIISESPEQPKLEPKVEPDPEVTITNEIAMLRSIDNNFIDLTGEPETEVIDLTGVEDSFINRNSSGIELIELEG
ncbi:hypothetical protein KCU98_g8841, partial [Aureobasidium melanogenum]